MQAYEVSWMRWLLGMTITGFLLVLFLVLGFYIPSRPGRTPGRRAETRAWPAGIEEKSRGIPSVLILLYLLMFLFIVGYTLYRWLAPVTF